MENHTPARFQSDDLATIEEIKLLKARYFRYMDTKNWDHWRELFTPDLHVKGDGSTFEDRDSFVNLVSGFLAKVTTAHSGFMPEITLRDSNTATAIWGMEDLLVFPGTPVTGMRGRGHYHEEYRRSEGRWRIKRMVLTRLHIEPLAGGFPEGGPWPL